jgi:hypothetical protein
MDFEELRRTGGRGEQEVEEALEEALEEASWRWASAQEIAPLEQVYAQELRVYEAIAAPATMFSH